MYYYETTVTPADNYRLDLNNPKWDILFMKRKPTLSEASVEEILQSFVDLGLVRKVPLPLSTTEMTYRTPKRDNAPQRYLTDARTLAQRYAQARDMQRIPLALASGVIIRLSPGGQNALVEKIINEFCPRFTPGGKPVYVGDTDKKWAYFDADYLRSLGITVEEHGKMPDLVVHFTEKNWLVLIEAVTSHGPVNPKRLTELRSLFVGSKAGLVFVTAFLNRRGLLRYLGEIAWETEVWVADAPDHMIHFNGERFLGPY